MDNVIRPAILALGFAGLLSACSVSGPPAGHVVPLPADLHTDIARPTGSAVLAAPAGWTPVPTILTPRFATPAAQLFQAMQADLLAQPHTWLTVSYPEQDQAFFIVRSDALSLPDIVVVQAVAAGELASDAVVFSQSRYDQLPFINSNATRVHRLIKSLSQRFGVVRSGTATQASRLE